MRLSRSESDKLVAEGKPKPHFESYTDCPSCGKWAVHWLRVLKPLEGALVWWERPGREVCEISSFGGGVWSEKKIYATENVCAYVRGFSVERECRFCFPPIRWGEL